MKPTSEISTPGQAGFEDLPDVWAAIFDNIQMGLLVFDEVFDKYDQKADITEKTDFEEFASRNIRNFVVRDRNHPSVFIWSVGNEMGDEQTNSNNGFQRYKAKLMLIPIL